MFRNTHPKILVSFLFVACTVFSTYQEAYAQTKKEKRIKAIQKGQLTRAGIRNNKDRTLISDIEFLVKDYENLTQERLLALLGNPLNIDQLDASIKQFSDILDLLKKSDCSHWLYIKLVTGEVASIENQIIEFYDSMKAAIEANQNDENNIIQTADDEVENDNTFDFFETDSVDTRITSASEKKDDYDDENNGKKILDQDATDNLVDKTIVINALFNEALEKIEKNNEDRRDESKNCFIRFIRYLMSCGRNQ